MYYNCYNNSLVIQVSVCVHFREWGKGRFTVVHMDDNTIIK